jgi:DNA-binding transcriptional MerR regulator
MTTAATEFLTIAEAAERTGVSAHTLRYYERIGALREPGMPIATMLRYAELARQGAATAAERKALLLAHRAEVAARAEQLHRDLDLIDYKIGVYDKIERERFGAEVS